MKRNSSMNKRWVKPVAIKVLIAFTAQLIYPSVSFALTSGPQQPEATNFTPADVSNLVDPFTGDFSYNIPMFDIGGYPVNLSYNSGITMDQEATWVGLGWNLNTGSITRDVRGLPDDFWGDTITRKFHTKPNITAGGSVTIGAEFVGYDLGVSHGLQFKYNNYTGFSVGETMNGGVQFDNGTNIGLGFSTTNGGLDINPNVSFGGAMGKKDQDNYKGRLGFGLNINSRTGISQLSLNASVTKSQESKNKKGITNTKTNGDKKQADVSASGGGAISFLNPTHTPQLNLPYQNYNFSGSFKIGGAVFFGDLNGTIGGFYSEQSLMTEQMVNPGYGYVYSEKGQYTDNAVHDFNREKDGPFTINTPSLPLTNYTYDAFTIRAQGIGGSFRAFRNDVGHVFDQQMYNPSVGGSFGAEIELGNAVDFGIDINVNFNESKSGKWKADNPAKDQLRFRDPIYNKLGETVFFKLVGEKVSEPDNNFKNLIQSDQPVAVGLQDENDPMTLNKLVSNSANSTTNTTQLNNNAYRDQNKRMVRNTLVQCFTLTEVKQAFPLYMKYMPSCAQDHHIVMIIVTTEDGTRYVFGLPAYNKVKKEVTFAVGKTIDGAPGLTNNASTNLVTYGVNDAGTGNRRGIDNYFDETITPAYVHTWYLTEVLSPDYSDITGNGPSTDDLGGYVLIKYGNENSNGTVTPNIPNYKWRTPSTGTSYQATYNEGLKSLQTDDKATYIYGEKDIWYPATMESKTQIIKFEYSDRLDGQGVTGQHSAIGGTKQRKIDRIKIFSRLDYQTNPSTSIPLKTIHFEYDYSLCNNTPNSSDVNKGKLTLKKVYFTYRNSYKAKYSAYSFEYPTTAAGNPNYDPTANDRWGTYRKNGVVPNLPRNEDYPYTYQDKTKADEYAACWNLSAINLPTGGKITVEYEADDYAYVQNKKACRMFQVIGASNASYGTITNDLYTQSSLTSPNEYIFFNLETPISTSLSQADADELVKKLYFDDPVEPEPNGPHKYLYFRFLTNVNNGNETPAYEYVGGYADVSSDQYCGARPGDYTKGWIKLKKIQADGGGSVDFYNPISKAGWSFSRINTPFYANGQPTPGQSDPGDFIRTILNASVIAQLVEFFAGPNNKLRAKGFSSKFVPYSSYVRLYDPNGIKYGGGHRVKQVKISDNWNNMETLESSFDYGQQYAYTTEDGSKSSGVASYEPMYGADENPFRIPVFYKKEYGPLIPDDRFYQEEPFGEGFFPSPSVGYSRVKIMNMQRANVTKTATGYTIKEFYTARDFPTITKRTAMDPKRAKMDPLLAILSPYVFDFQTVSQGFSIELNDMHGKPKREAVYQENNDQEPISKVEHFYKVETLSAHEINNNMPVLEQNGNVSQREIGTEIDMVADFRESSSFAGNVDIGFNSDYMQFGPIPLIVLAIFPRIKFEDTRFRSASVTKVINRYGIEVRTEAYDLGSKVMTENKLYNGISGEVLCTQVNNEYEDDRYTLGIPAYWAYDGMKQASTNAGFTMVQTLTQTMVEGSSSSYPGRIIIGGTSPYKADDYFEPGDEVLVTYGEPGGRGVVNSLYTGTNHYNILWVAKHSDGYLYFINNLGRKYVPPPSATTITFKVIRSGHRNILDPKITEIASLDAPVTNFTPGSGVYINTTSKALSISANVFAEQWKGLKRWDNCTPYTTCVCEDIPFMTAYGHLFKPMVENNIPFTPNLNNCTSPPMRQAVMLYDANGYYNGFNPLLLNELQTTHGCTLNSNSMVVLHNSVSTNSSWYPQNDNNFMSGNLVAALQIEVYDKTNCSIVCNPCDQVFVALKDPSFVPSWYNSGTSCSFTLNYSANYYNTTGGIVTGSWTIPSNRMTFIPLTVQGLPKVLFVFKTTGSSCIMRKCQEFEHTRVDFNIADTVNPYIHNILGKWRPYQNYTLLADRYSNMNELTSGGSSRVPDLRNDGYIASYTPFWKITSSAWNYTGYDADQWKRTTTMTQYHPSGVQVEEKNALDILSAALYGYYEQLAIAVAQNTEYKELGYDGFEDYGYVDNSNTYTSANCSPSHHFRFTLGGTVDLTTSEWHTGRYSLKITSGSAEMQRTLQPASTFRTDRTAPYILQTSDLTEFFGPVKANKEYIFSFWVKQSNYTPVTFDYTGVSGDVLQGSTSIITTLEKSPIIEGWQRFEYRFRLDISNASNTIKLKLNGGSGFTTYFDDVRVHPVEGSMKSYVYDPTDLRFMAELDENNYATFYEYDEDGALVRVKKETERGIMTIQENRYGNFKQ